MSLLCSGIDNFCCVQLFSYWPDTGEVEVQFGSIRVMVESENLEHLYTSRTIRLTNTKVVRARARARACNCLGNVAHSISVDVIPFHTI